MDARPKYVEILNNERIKIYQEFILVNQQIYDLLKINFFFSSDKKEIYYIHKTIDILIINDCSQYSILFGLFDELSNSYTIKYIFDYISKDLIKKELNEILVIGYKEYIRGKTVFNQNEPNDNISPIFENDNDMIGYCYKYNNNVDYNKNKYYIDIISIEKFKKNLSLYKNYRNIYKKMYQNNNYIEEKYYLINKDVCNEIKKYFEYEEKKSSFLKQRKTMKI